MMDTLVSPLVLTKIRVPARRPRLVARPRLLELLGQRSGASLVLVSAPAGYGKTTLLMDWAQALLGKGMAVAWYALDASDDDLIPFSAYLIASLAQALGESAELAHLGHLLRTSPGMDVQKVLQSAINAILLSGQECLLVLDDYHLIHSPDIHQAVGYLLEHLPENLRVAVGSRTDPPLPLGRMRARGEMLEIRPGELSFTESETARFLNDLMQLALSAEGIASLKERTEGWIAGLQLAAISLAGREDKEKVIESFSGSHRFLVDYLLEEVFKRQTDEVQTFLLTTSILERMCGPLCDALMCDALMCDGLMGSSGGREVLEELEQANLFVVALDEEGYWYRYHHLFGTFLRARLLKQDAGQVAARHRAATEWLVAHQLLREAAQHAFQTGDWAYAAAFVEQHSFTMLLHSEISTIYEWCAAFPEEVMQAHPMLCLLQCWGLVFSFRKQNRAKIEARLQLVEQSMAGMESSQEVKELAEHAAVVRVFLAMAPERGLDLRAQLAHAQSMLGEYEAGNVSQFSALLAIGYAHLALHEAQAAAAYLEKARQAALLGGLYFGVVESTFNLACLAYSQGALKHAADLCRQGRVDLDAMLAHTEQELPAVGCLDIGLGCVLVEQDRLEEAEEHLRHGLELIGTARNPYYLLTAFVTLARLYEVQGRVQEALACVEKLEEALPDIAFCTEGLRVRLLLRFSSKDAATRERAIVWSKRYAVILAEAATLAGMGPLGAAEVFYLTDLAWMQVQIHLGNPAPARTMVEQYRSQERSHGLMKREIELCLLAAQAAHAEGDRQAVRESLTEALNAAQTEGFLRIFDQGDGLRAILAEAAAEGIHGEALEKILAAIDGDQDRRGGRSGKTREDKPALGTEVIESLSERELEVLGLMALGATNQAIADQLVITVGTVKSHINHILRKLAANNRTEAVAMARGLGLLED
jgi:LuxR family maltose regulon positive regulatory protein